MNLKRLFYFMKNREIKFRALTSGSGKMVYGDLIKIDNDLLIAGVEMEAGKFKNGFIELQCISVFPGSVGQFTGIKDSKGVDIYEGDIILQKSNPDWHSKVEEKFVIEFGCQDLGHSSYQQTIGWNASSIRCFFNENPSLRKGIRDLCIKHPGITAIVIGNIYENPELLNG